MCSTSCVFVVTEPLLNLHLSRRVWERVAARWQLQTGTGNGREGGHSMMTLDGHCVVAVTAAGEDFRVPTGPGN